ncbi:hypothetical protein BH09SUM1_BH09SUM1_15550 [soil metagenome]
MRRLLRSVWTLAVFYALINAIALFATVNLSDPWAALFYLNGVVFPAWCYFHARRLHDRLHANGYGWITRRDCWSLFLSARVVAFHTPPRDELAVVPGYEDEVEALREIVVRATET